MDGGVLVFSVFKRAQLVDDGRRRVGVATPVETEVAQHVAGALVDKASKRLRLGVKGWSVGDVDASSSYPEPSPWTAKAAVAGRNFNNGACGDGRCRSLVFVT